MCECSRKFLQDELSFFTYVVAFRHLQPLAELGRWETVSVPFPASLFWGAKSVPLGSSPKVKPARGTVAGALLAPSLDFIAFWLPLHTCSGTLWGVMPVVIRISNSSLLNLLVQLCQIWLGNQIVPVGLWGLWCPECQLTPEAATHRHGAFLPQDLWLDFISKRHYLEMCHFLHKVYKVLNCFIGYKIGLEHYIPGYCSYKDFSGNSWDSWKIRDSKIS